MQTQAKFLPLSHTCTLVNMYMSPCPPLSLKHTHANLDRLMCPLIPKNTTYSCDLTFALYYSTCSTNIP